MKETGIGFYWFWPVLAFLLAGLWLWTMLRLRRAPSAARSLASESVLRPVEAEDALKAAYGLQQAGGSWGAEKLAHSMGLPRGMAEVWLVPSSLSAGPTKMLRATCT
jgi:hypothetical protein